jgi:hypothetical protein
MLVLLAVTSEIAGTVNFFISCVQTATPTDTPIPSFPDFFGENVPRQPATDGCVSNHLRSVRNASKDDASRIRHRKAANLSKIEEIL